MVRTPCFDNNGIKKGAWTAEEDCKLQAHIMKHGHDNWRKLPTLAGLKRCGKSCRLRWLNYLRPDVKRENYTKAEEDLIIQLHEQHGGAMIASKLPGRSDNDIKNHWYHLKKRTTTNNKNHKLSIGDQIMESDTSRKNPSMEFNILESWPLSSLAPLSSATFDDGGLEEMLNSCDLFAEMTSLISPYQGESVAQGSSITIEDVGRELLEEDYFWSLHPSREMQHNNELALSPCPSYFHQNFFDDLFFDQTIQEMMMP